MLLNISSDTIILHTGEDVFLVSFDDVEREFPRVLHEVYETVQSETITIINGPGSFTQLRVGVLACNILNMSKQLNIEFLDVSKITLYEKAMKEGSLPAVGIIFMGQRKKMRCIQEGQGPQVVSDEDVLSYVGERSYFIDWMGEDHPVLAVLDTTYMVSQQYLDGGHICRKYDGTVCRVKQDDVSNRVAQLTPRYLMEPQIG